MRRVAVVLSVVGIILFAGCKKPNHAPDAPAVPSGPTSCAVGVSYTFSSSATDPDGDDVAIRFDWGDGDTSDWSPYVASGDTVTMSHAWSAYASYNVKAQSKDRRSAGSPWSDACVASVARRWTRTLGGSSDDWGQSVQQTPDGGYIIAGTIGSRSADGSDIWLIRLDASGDTVWTRSFGGDGSQEGYSVQLTQDGGYIVVGFDDAQYCGQHLVRYDKDGNKLWDTTRSTWGDILGYSVEQTSDGGYVIAGVVRDYMDDWNFWLQKTDPSGNELWNTTLRAPINDGACSAHQTQDGGYVVAGYTASFGAGSADIWLVKTDSSGDTSWARTYGGAAHDEALSMQVTSDGGYIVVGWTLSYGAGAGDVWLIKTDAAGNKVWDKTFGGTSREKGYSVQQTQDGGYIVVGTTESFGAGDRDVWLVKTDASGDSTWTRTFGGAGLDDGYSVQQTLDGGYIITGFTMSYGAGGLDVWLIKTDANGEVDEGGGK